jgi:uncharacterized protein YfaT (DUF1175 family)
MSKLTTEDIRNFLLDRSVEDNDLELDVAFSDDEIRDAMKRAARAYNSIPPFVNVVTPNALPGDSNIFLHATAEQLMISLLSKLRRNDVDYTAGGVGTNLVAKRIAHLQNEIKEHREMWQKEATDTKLYMNINACYRTF